MNHQIGLSAGAFLLALAGGTAASAAVTADEVWQAWIDSVTTSGATVTSAATDRSGDTLVVTGVVVASDVPESSTSIAISEIWLRELGDGSVEITMSESLPITAITKPETGELVDMKMTLSHSGMTTVVSGEPGDMSYAMAAPQLGISLDSLTVDGAAVELGVTATLMGMISNYRMTTDGGMKVTSSLTSESLDFAVNAVEPEGGGKVSMSGSMTGLSGTSDMTVPDGIDMNDMPAALNGGFAVAAEFTYEAGSYNLDFQDGAETTQSSGSGAGGSLNITMSKAGLDYGVTGGAGEMSVTSSALPFPVNVSLSEVAMRLAMPLSKSDTAQPFALLLKLVDFTISDEVWGMVDPAGQLPRDPATVIVDLVGSVKLTADITDPAMTDSAVPPGEIHALNIVDLKVTAAGAELTGAGAFTFDNSDMSMGYPKPLGALDLALKGGNKLLDALVAMGLVPEDQAMGARMMTGIFAVPAGDDYLTSTIEFKADGGLYANGQRLQ